MKPEVEVFDPGMISNAAYYIKKGVLKTPVHFQFCMGCAKRYSRSMKNLIFMKETMDSLCPGSTWSCFGVGHSAMEILYGAVALEVIFVWNGGQCSLCKRKAPRQAIVNL